MNRPAQLCIARHGETDWNSAGILQGWLDVPINDQGRRQARELADSLAAVGFSAVWSSPLSRARQTAEIVAAALGLPPPRFHDGLKERNFGVIQGIPKVELADLNPLLLQQIMRRNPATHFEDGESMDEFADRVLNAVTGIGANHADARVLVVTHGWVMDVVTRQLLGKPRHAMLNMKRKNGESIWLEATADLIVPAAQHP
jgi:probable phosphoglycerate mutase